MVTVKKRKITKKKKIQKKKKNSVGRPTKYKSEYCQAIIKFFSHKPYISKKVITTGKNDYKKESFQLVPNAFPRFDRFADSIGVNGDTLVEWTKAVYPDSHPKAGQLKYPEFSAAYTRAKELQKWFLIENGLTGLYNPRFAIFAATNITDMREKIQHQGDPENPIQHDHNHEVSEEFASIVAGIAKRIKK